jgi:hypothetical protein
MTQTPQADAVPACIATTMADVSSIGPGRMRATPAGLVSSGAMDAVARMLETIHLSQHGPMLRADEVRSAPDSRRCGHVGFDQKTCQKAEIRSVSGMTRRSASVVAILLASLPGAASAQVNCAAIAYGPARTDCYLALNQFYRAKSDLAAAQARAQSDTAWYRAITGTDHPAPAENLQLGKPRLSMRKTSGIEGR